jgi:hypothetical protein
MALRSRADAELEALLARIDRALGEVPPGDPRVNRLCADAGRMADQVREALRRAARAAQPTQRALAAENVRRRAAAWINRVSNQVLSILSSLSPRDIDRVVGCLARVEHAIGRETLPLRRLKVAAWPLLGRS